MWRRDKFPFFLYENSNSKNEDKTDLSSLKALSNRTNSELNVGIGTSMEHKQSNVINNTKGFAVSEGKSSEIDLPSSSLALDLSIINSAIQRRKPVDYDNVIQTKFNLEPINVIATTNFSRSFKIENQNNDKPPDLTIGFKTGRGEEIIASQVNIEKFKRTYDEILKEDCGNVEKFLKAGKKTKIESEGSKNDNNQKIVSNNCQSSQKNKKDHLNISVAEMQDVNDILNSIQDLSDTFTDDEIMPDQTIGFKTGNGKEIKATQKNIEKYQRSYSQILKEDCNDIEQRDIGCKGKFASHYTKDFLSPKKIENNNSDTTGIFQNDTSEIPQASQKNVETFKVSSQVFSNGNTLLTEGKNTDKDRVDVIRPKSKNSEDYTDPNSRLSPKHSNDIDLINYNCNSKLCTSYELDDSDMFEDEYEILENNFNKDSSQNQNINHSMIDKNLCMKHKNSIDNMYLNSNQHSLASAAEMKDVDNILNILKDYEQLKDNQMAPGQIMSFTTGRGNEITATQVNVEKFKRTYDEILKENCGNVEQFVKAGKRARNEFEDGKDFTSDKTFSNNCDSEVLLPNDRDQVFQASQENIEKSQVVFQNFSDVNSLLEKNSLQSQEPLFKEKESSTKEIFTSNLFAKPNSNIEPENKQLGVLFNKKLKIDRKTLCEFVQNKEPTLYTIDQLKMFNLNPNIISCTIRNAVNFRFHLREFYNNIPLESSCNKPVIELILDGTISLRYDKKFQCGLKEFSKAFLDSLSNDSVTVSFKWITRNFKWIIVKLASMERSFPDIFGGKVLTPENVLLQLRYRYDCEMILKRRSALQHIFDSSSEVIMTKCIVLFVSKKIYIANAVNKYILELSDGWHTISGHLDAPLNKAVTENKIKIGTKLIMVAGINKKNNRASLRLRANSTRRVKYDTKLGFQKKCLYIKLDTILSAGGIICNLKLYILRIYPLEAEKPNIAGNSSFMKANTSAENENSIADNRKYRFLNLRVIDAYVQTKSYFLLVYKPDINLINLLKENIVINISNVLIDSNDKKTLSTGKFSKINVEAFLPNIKDKYRRKVTLLSDIHRIKPVFNEFDTFGIIFINDSDKNDQPCIYIADQNLNILCITFVENKNKYQDILRLGNVIGIKNLEWNLHFGFDKILSANSTRKTTFNDDCKGEYFNETFINFKQKILNFNQNEYIQKCIENLNLLKMSSDSD